MKKLFFSVFCLMLITSIYAQIPDGSTAPDFTLTSLDGDTYNLYEILDEGKAVAIDFSATWCGNCWNYHNSHTFENAYLAHGPEGTDKLQSFFIESDGNTSEECITNSPGCVGGTIGNWVEGTTHPYFNLEGDDLQVKTDYGAIGVPTIIIISPDKRVWEIGNTQSLFTWATWINESFALEATAIITNTNCSGTSGGSIDLETSGGRGSLTYVWSDGSTGENLVDVGAGTYSVTITDENDYFIIVEDLIVEDEGGVSSMTAPVDISISCSSDEYPIFQNYDAFINAGGIVDSSCDIIESTFTVNESINGPSCSQTITRIYSVTDEVGATLSSEQQITLADTEVPTISCPANITVSDILLAPPYQNYNELVQQNGNATDNCEINTQSFELISDTQNGNIYTRTYQIADQCGNINSCDHQITVTSMGGELMCPDEVTVGIITDAPPYETYSDFVDAGGALLGTIAEESTFALTSEVSDGEFCPETITREYTIEDNQNIVYTCLQHIVVMDEEINVTIEANVTDLTVDFSSTITGNPFGLEWDFGDDNLSNDPNPNHTYEEAGVYMVCCFVANLCNDVNECIYVYVGVEPGGLVDFTTDVDCIDDVPEVFESLNDFIDGGGTQVGEIEENSFVFVSEEINMMDCGGTHIRTYETTDIYGTIVPVTHTILYEDNEAPETSNISATTSCDQGDVALLDDFQSYIDLGGDASDNCEIDESSLTLVSEESDGNKCPEIYTRTYELADHCGNTATFEFNITVHDQEAPTITVPDITVETNDDVPALPTNYDDFLSIGGMVTDNCDLNTNTFQVNEESDGNTMPEILTRTYSIEDPCGNLSIQAQSITVNNPVSINDIEGLETFVVQPNPANEFIQVSFDIQKTTILDLLIFDTAGKLIEKQQISKNNGSIDIAVDQWSPGLYLVQLKTKDGISSQKVIIE